MVPFVQTKTKYLEQKKRQVLGQNRPTMSSLNITKKRSWKLYLQNLLYVFFCACAPSFLSPYHVLVKAFQYQRKDSFLSPCFASISLFSLCFFCYLHYALLLLFFCLSFSIFCLLFFSSPPTRSLKGLIYSLIYLYLGKIQCINSRMQIPANLQ